MHELHQPAHYQLTNSPTPHDQPEMCGLRIYSLLECDTMFAGNLLHTFLSNVCFHFKGKLQLTWRHIPQVCNLQLNYRYLPFCRFPTARPSKLASRSWWRRTHVYFALHSEDIRRHCSFQNIQDTHARQFILPWCWICHVHRVVTMTPISVSHYWFP
jgi:hypothetical protein